MGNINTFQQHLRLPNMSWGFRFQSATVLVNISITKSSFIVLSECLLLAQSCVALVFSHGYMQQRKERRVDNVQKMGSVSNFWAQNRNAERTGNGNLCLVQNLCQEQICCDTASKLQRSHQNVSGGYHQWH